MVENSIGYFLRKDNMKYYSILLLLFFSTAAYALSIQGENYLEYERNDSTEIDAFKDKLNIDAMEQNFMAGIRFYLRERTDSLGQGIEQIDRRYFSWKQDYIKATFGNFYQTFGRGLTFAAFEDETIDLDRFLDGVIIKGGKRHYTATGMVAKGWNDQTGNKVMSKGGELAFGIFPENQISFGGSFIRADVFPEDEGNVNEYDLPALFLGARHKGFDFYTEIAQKQDVYNKDVKKGEGLYSTIGYYKPGYGINFEYKNFYRMDFDYNSPPPCTKSGYNLNGNSDEYGYKTEANLALIKEVNMSGGYSKIDTKNSDEYRREIFGETKYSLPDDKGFTTGYHTYTAIMYYSPSRGYYIHKWHEPALKVSYKFLTKHTVTVYGQMRLNNHDITGKYKEYYSYLVYNFSPYFKLVGALEKSEIEDPYSNNKTTWGYGQVIVPVTNDHELSVMYGSERGGLSCAGGVCKYKEPFTGFRITFRSNF